MSEKYASWVTLRPQWDRCHRGEAKVRIFNFKTTWSEFQKASQTATEQGKANYVLYGFYYKTGTFSISASSFFDCTVRLIETFGEI